MKISCIQENLKQGLFLVSHLANKNINLPILNNILIEVKDNQITLAGTNLEIGVTCQIRGKVEKEGSFTVNAKLMNDYINLLPKERIDLELSNNSLAIKCSNHNTKINGLPASDFPLIPRLNKERPFVCQADKFRAAVSQVIFATANNESRPEISGVFMKIKNKVLTLAGTDSYRLAQRQISLEEASFNEEKTVIVPVKTLQEVMRVISSYKDSIDIPANIEIYIQEGQLLFVYDVVEVFSRLVEGKYPDYEQIIPSKYETSVITNRPDLIKAVKTSSLFSKTGINDINLEFVPTEGSDKTQSFIKTNSMNELFGENESVVFANITGLKNGIVLNYNYLLDGLNNIDSNEVKIEIIDSSNPCLITPVDNKQEPYLYIIMPIKQ